MVANDDFVTPYYYRKLAQHKLARSGTMQGRAPFPLASSLYQQEDIGFMETVTPSLASRKGYRGQGIIAPVRSVRNGLWLGKALDQRPPIEYNWQTSGYASETVQDHGQTEPMSAFTEAAGSFSC